MQSDIEKDDAIFIKYNLIISPGKIFRQVADEVFSGEKVAYRDEQFNFIFNDHDFHKVKIPVDSKGNLKIIIPILFSFTETST